MHLRSPAGPISVFVLNPPDSEAISSSANPLPTSDIGELRYSCSVVLIGTGVNWATLY